MLALWEGGVMNGPGRCKKPLIKCSLPDYLHGKLNEEQRFEVREHLVVCPSCIQDLQEMIHAVEGLALDRRSKNYKALEARRKFQLDRKSTRLNSSHQIISYAVFCFKKKNRNDAPEDRQNCLI